MLGGAAVTEEVFPGLPVQRRVLRRVACCGPEIIRELDLPRHGLEILPLDGTFTPLDGDYLWRVNDHGRTMRELRRWSATDAEAYEEYGQLMVDMARFIKPILSIVPPDPGRIDPREWLPLVGLATAFRELPERQQAAFVQLMTMSAADFLDQWFETDPLKATMSASGIIGTFQGVRSPGTAYVLLHHYMGEIDGAFRAWGIPRGGTGGVSEAIAAAARDARRRDPDRGAGRARSHAGRPGARAWCSSRGEEIDGRRRALERRRRPTFLGPARAGDPRPPSSRPRSAATSSAGRRAR